MPSSNGQTIGVIGGLGPAATLDFCQRIVRLTNASCEQDHLHVIVDNNPHTPDRNLAIAGQGESPAPALAASARRLQLAGADFLVMPCNTAHAFATDIIKSVSIPFVHMVDECVNAIRQMSGNQSVGLLAANGCLQSNLYQQRLQSINMTFHLPDQFEQDRMMQAIYQIKTAGPNVEAKNTMVELAQSLQQSGAEMIIAGCTEVPLVLSEEDGTIPVFDSLDFLAQQTVLYATNQRSISSSDIAV